MIEDTSILLFHKTKYNVPQFFSCFILFEFEGGCYDYKNY